MTHSDRPATVQRRRKSLPDPHGPDVWQDWRNYENEGLALAAIVIDMRRVKAYEYRIKPDPFAVQLDARRS